MATTELRQLYGALEIHHELRLVTPEDARHWLAACAYPPQRRLSERHVALLMRAMQQDTMKVSTLEFARWDEVLYLTDGQHRLTALLRTGLPQVFLVVTHTHATLEGVHEQYSRTDTGRRRLGREAPKWKLFLDDLGVARMDNTGLYAAMALIGNGFASTGSPHVNQMIDLDDRLTVADLFREGIHRYAEIQKGAVSSARRHLTNAGVAAVACVTLQHQEKAATGFWELLAATTFREERDGAWWALQFFLDRGKMRLQAHEIARGIAFCWNTHYEEGKRQSLRALTTDTPIRIMGTPYTGSRIRYLLPHLEKEPAG